MDRNQKIKLLSAIQKGEKTIQEAIPLINVVLLEYEPNKFFDGQRFIKADEIDAYIEQIKADNPHHIVNVTYMYHEEFNSISEQLEKEY